MVTQYYLSTTKSMSSTSISNDLTQGIEQSIFRTPMVLFFQFSAVQVYVWELPDDRTGVAAHEKRLKSYPLSFFMVMVYLG